MLGQAIALILRSERRITAMRRLERARLIRDSVLAYPREEWQWTDVSGEQYLDLHREGWSASLRSHFNAPPAPPPDLPSYLHAVALQRSRQPLPNGLDLWLSPGGKVLSVEWNHEELRIISMKPGAWESELFGVGQTAQ